MKNVHPIYNIKALMIKRELAKDPKLRNESWERFLPKFVSKSLSKRKQPMKKKQKKKYTPFPPPQTESKVDKLLASGEYFLKDDQRKKKKHEEKLLKQQEANKSREERRKKAFEAPQEPKFNNSKPLSQNDVDVENLKKKIKQAKRKRLNIT